MIFFTTRAIKFINIANLPNLIPLMLVISHNEMHSRGYSLSYEEEFDQMKTICSART